MKTANLCFRARVMGGVDKTGFFKKLYRLLFSTRLDLIMDTLNYIFVEIRPGNALFYGPDFAYIWLVMFTR